jgi:hypothetical protein
MRKTIPALTCSRFAAGNDVVVFPTDALLIVVRDPYPISKALTSMARLNL